MNANSDVVFKTATILLTSAEMIVNHILTINLTALEKQVFIFLDKIKTIKCCILELGNTVTTTALLNGDKVLWLFKYWYLKLNSWVSLPKDLVAPFSLTGIKKSVIWISSFSFFNSIDLFYLRLLILVYFRFMFIPFLFFAAQILILPSDCEFFTFKHKNLWHGI